MLSTRGAGRAVSFSSWYRLAHKAVLQRINERRTLGCLPYLSAEPSLQDVTSLYTLGKILGKGQFGTTRVAEEKATGSIYACKSIAKRKLV